MKRARSNTPKNRTRVSQSATKARKRAAAFKLESLEERTLLSTTNYVAAAVGATDPSQHAHPVTTNPSAPTTQVQTVTSGTGQNNPASNVIANDPNAVTAAAAANGKMPANGLRNSIPSGQGPSAGLSVHDTVVLAKNVGPVSGVWAGLTTSSAAGNGSSSGSGISASTGGGGTTLSPAGGGSGPGGGIAPAQIASAYGLNLVMFGSIHGDGTGQTIAVVDVGDNPGFLNSTDPNYSTSAPGPVR